MKEIVGITPRLYMKLHTAQTLHRQILRSPQVMATLYIHDGQVI